MDILKNCWKYFVSIVGALVIIGSLFAFSDRYVTRELLAESLENVNKSIQYQFNANRYATLTDQMVQIKLLLKKNPEDKDLEDELKRIEYDRNNALKELKMPDKK